MYFPFYMSDSPPPLQSGFPQEPVSPGAPSSGSGKKWGLGCGIGCLVAVVVVAVLAIVGLNLGKKFVTGLVEQATSDTPVELLAPEIAPEKAESAVKRFDAFVTAMEGGEVKESLILTEEDINALISNHRTFEAVSESMVVSIVDDKLTSEVSFSLDALDLPDSFLSEAMKGKFFNGEVTLSLGTVAGRPAMYIEGVSVGGSPLPASFMTELSKENILQEAQSDPELSQFFNRIEELKIDDNRLVITPRLP